MFIYALTVDQKSNRCRDNLPLGTKTIHMCVKFMFYQHLANYHK